MLIPVNSELDPPAKVPLNYSLVSGKRRGRYWKRRPTAKSLDSLHTLLKGLGNFGRGTAISPKDGRYAPEGAHSTLSLPRNG